VIFILEYFILTLKTYNLIDYVIKDFLLSNESIWSGGQHISNLFKCKLSNFINILGLSPFPFNNITLSVWLGNKSLSNVKNLLLNSLHSILCRHRMLSLLYIQHHHVINHFLSFKKFFKRNIIFLIQRSLLANHGHATFHSKHLFTAKSRHHLQILAFQYLYCDY
jgi:hypothetical protein